VLLLVLVIGSLGFNFQIVLPLLAGITFHGNAATYGFMSAFIAAGSVVGALYVASRARPTKQLVVIAGFAFGAAEVITAFVPTLRTAYIALPFVGLATITFISASNAALQLWSRPEMRGRVLGLFSILLLGSTPIGGPLLGWVSQRWSPRAALGLGGIASMIAAVVIGAILIAHHRREVQPVGPSDELIARGEMVAAEATEAS